MFFKYFNYLAQRLLFPAFFVLPRASSLLVNATIKAMNSYVLR